MLYDKRWDKIEIESAETIALRAAREIISDPAKWTCGDYARDADCAWVPIDSQSAVSFCAVGALAVTLGLTVREAEDSTTCKYLNMAAIERGYTFAYEANDNGHASAMAMFDRAIQLASADSAQR